MCMIAPFYSFENVKADGSFTFPYLFSDYEYRQLVDTSDPLYDPDGLVPTFCNFNSFVDWNNSRDYTEYIEDFADFLETDSHFCSFNNLGNMVIAFTGNYSNGVFKCYMMSSERPLYICGKNYYSFIQGVTSDFSTNYLELRYSYYQGSYSFVTVESTNNNFLGGGNEINGTLFKLSNGSVFNEGIVYSDAIVRCKYRSESSSLDASDGSYSMNYNAHLEAELDGWSNYPVCAIDRRTLFPDFVASQVSEDDRKILEKSRCGLKRQAYYVGGSPDELQSYYDFELNEYTKLRKNRCQMKISYNFDMGGQYRTLEQELDTRLTTYYGDSQANIITAETNFGSVSVNGDSNIITVDLEDKNSVDEVVNSLNSYFNSMTNPSMKIYDRGSCNLNYFIRALGNTLGYHVSSSSNWNFGYSDKLQIGHTWVNTQNESINYMKIIFKVQIIDLDNSSKNSMIQRFSYDLVTGSVDDYGDPIIYDDTDIIDHYDDPTWEVPTVATTEQSPNGPTTQVIINPGTPGSGTVTVTNSNVNNNNPQIHVTPQINVYADGGDSDDDSDGSGVIVIKDDDSVEFEDVQDVMDGVENFLDFGDTFYDEYMSAILSVIPAGVWRPFVVASAFISLAAMIGYVLRR